MTSLSQWSDLIGSLWDKGPQENVRLPGVCLEDWLLLVQHDLDDIDAIYVDHEVLGGD